jgi:hypothetical protein
MHVTSHLRSIAAMQEPGDISKRKRGAVRLLFVVTLFLLGIQYALVETVGKPFPSIMMPGFAGHGGYESGTVRVRVMEVVFFDRAGHAHPFSTRELLSDYPESFLPPMMEYFRPLPDASAHDDHESGGGRLRRLRQRFLPDLYQGQRKRTTRENEASIREWLRQQTIRLVPGHEIERAEFDWFVDTVQTIDGARKIRREPAGQFVVHLGKESP